MLRETVEEKWNCAAIINLLVESIMKKINPTFGTLKIKAPHSMPKEWLGAADHEFLKY